jgi:tetratricopeptide (TPR) repeat protein
MKKALAFAGLGLMAAACLLVYTSLHLTYKSRALDLDPEPRLALLRTAGKLFRWNEMSAEESGVARVTRAANNLGDIAQAREDIQTAYANLRRALTLNPGSAMGHYYYAQTLSLMRFLGPAGADKPFQEYEKAARLAGPNRALRLEIGLALLGRWGSLSAEEHRFTENLIHDALPDRDLVSFGEVLNLWDLNSRDYAAMGRIVPDSPTLLRAYAEFLGEKSLSLEARHAALARAESLEYDQAVKDYGTGMNLMKYGRTTEADQHLGASLGLLKGIRFFGLLSGAENAGAQVQKVTDLRSSVSLDLAQVRLEETRKLDSAQDALRDYLELETNYDRVTSLETYLRDLRVIPENETDVSFKDVHQLSFEILLMFKLHKYRQIISLGGRLQRSLLVSDEAVRKDLSEIFQLVGDSYLKLDFVYESEAFYQRALELTPNDPEVLFRLTRYYERRNDEDRLREVARLLRNVLSAGNVLASPRMLSRGTPLDIPLVLDLNRKRVRLEFQFGTLPGNARPLVSVDLNGRVYWEDFLPGPGFSLDLDAREGVNSLRITSVNGPAVVLKLTVTGLSQAPGESGEGPVDGASMRP